MAPFSVMCVVDVMPEIVLRPLPPVDFILLVGKVYCERRRRRRHAWQIDIVLLT